MAGISRVNLDLPKLGWAGLYCARLHSIGKQTRQGWARLKFAGMASDKLEQIRLGYSRKLCVRIGSAELDSPGLDWAWMASGEHS